MNGHLWSLLFDWHTKEWNDQLTHHPCNEVGTLAELVSEVRPNSPILHLVHIQQLGTWLVTYDHDVQFQPQFHYHNKLDLW